MQKPSDDTGVELHHYAAHLAAHFMCANTCKRGIAHNDANFHDHHEQIKALPDVDTTKALAQKIKDELFSHSSWMAPHIYSSIWHQLDLVIAEARPCIIIPQ